MHLIRLDLARQIPHSGDIYCLDTNLNVHGKEGSDYKYDSTTEMC